ncbi:hypothetical protein COS33_00685 [Candidatus Wolfebacteria bacterium CG02_land_8_20_14_3_00_37_12]|uniref:Zn-dependent hydrolase n=2 Tax=Candidatus Wolfeibacteriota TaxID=1752735 RepID=A0A2M7Q7M6_9BACT|nr:MAG: hypothetical protein COS33_00685 [Candidatus Wolfebacteria bacterium CG02_land_8_20_14_3_00_37_12]PIY59447.1 MAG: hypothetical protein COY96_01805 [Candidatus Wolfebacteria bacterium CG_4_10_14_0_8_um_filter_37_11]
MVISFYGEGCFKIQSGEAVVLIDPPSPQSGLTAPRFKFDVLLKTLVSNEEVELGFLRDADGEGFKIIGPGEYDIKNIIISGYGLVNESTDKFIKTVYLVEIEGIKMCFLGHVSEALATDIAKYLEEIDVLFIPAGGKPFIEQKAAVKIIKQIAPKIVVPSFFKISGLKRPSADLKIFFEEGGYKAEAQEKLTIKKKDLAEIKKTKVICLKA